jgi:hypothetical protein
METTNEQKVLQQIINEAWENEAFKTELISNPLKAIEKLTGHRLKLKENQSLEVRDQTDESTIYINIPARHNMEDVELNEEQLEAIAGGAPPPREPYSNPFIDWWKDLF